MADQSSDESQIQWLKLWDDFFKQLISLSTGALILLATFADRFAGNAPTWLAVVAVCGFIITIVSCLVVKLLLIDNMVTDNRVPLLDEDARGNATAASVLASWVSFVVAIVFLGIYAAFQL